MIAPPQTACESVIVCQTYAKVAQFRIIGNKCQDPPPQSGKKTY